VWWVVGLGEREGAPDFVTLRLKALHDAFWMFHSQDQPRPVNDFLQMKHMYWAGLVLAVKYPEGVLQSVKVQPSWPSEVDVFGPTVPGGCEQGQIHLPLAEDG